MISVIIPTYNREKAIIPCIESVLNQTFREFEIIIVDDCSTDHTGEVLKPYLNDRFSYYRLDRNRRACYARNFGMRKARGELVAFQDSDDIWYPEKLEKQLKKLREEEADFVFCAMNRVMKDRTLHFPRRSLDVYHDFYRQELKLNAVSTQTILMKKDAAIDISFDESLKRYQDWDFAIRAAKKYKAAYVPEVLVDSVVGADSITSVNNEFDALNTIYQKYQDEIVPDEEIHAFYLWSLGDSLRRTDPKKAAFYFRKSLQIQPDRKVFTKYLLSLSGIRY